MKNLLLSYCLCLLMPLAAVAQTYQWAHNFTGSGLESIYGVCEDKEGNIYTVGAFSSPVDFDPGQGIALKTPTNTADVFILKLNTRGEFMWVKTIPCTGDMFGFTIALDANNNIYINGIYTGTADFDPGLGQQNRTSSDNSSGDPFYLKLNAQGDFEWVGTIRKAAQFIIFDYPRMVVDSAGNVYGSGTVAGFTTWAADIDPSSKDSVVLRTEGEFPYLFKISTNGNTLWTKSFMANKDMSFRNIALNKNQLVLSGMFKDTLNIPELSSTYYSHKNGSPMIIKIDTSNGIPVFCRSFGDRTFNINAITFDDNDNFLLTGAFGGTQDFDFGPEVQERTAEKSDIFILKTDNSLNFKWMEQVGDNSFEGGSNIYTDKYGNIITSGTKGSYLNFATRPNTIFPSSGNKPYIWKTNAQGATLWVQTLCTSGTGSGSYGYKNRNNEIVMSSSFSGTAKTDPKSNNEMRTANQLDALLFKWKDDCFDTTRSTQQVLSCSAYRSPSGRYWYTTSGTYLDTIGNTKGCDSIITLNLTINSVTRSTTDSISCQNMRSPSGKYTYTATGTYLDTISNVTGCDSIVTTNFIRYNEARVSTDTNSCKAIISPSRSYTYTQSGTYQDTLQTSNGCDSIITITVTITPLNTQLNVQGGTLQAAQAGAQYQWYNCNTMQLIPGQTAQSFTPSTSGSYAAIISQNQCADTTACVNITEVNEFITVLKGEIYPNPFSQNLFINFVLPQASFAKIYISDLLGKEIAELHNGNMAQGKHSIKWSPNTSIPNGIYLLNITMGNKQYTNKIELVR